MAISGATRMPEPVARSVAPSLLLYMRVSGPLVRLFDGSANALLRLFRIEPVQELQAQGRAACDLGQARIFLPGIVGQVGNRMRLRIPAGDVMLSVSRPDGLSALNIVPAKIVSLTSGRGPGVLVVLQVFEHRLLARITRRSQQALALVTGQDVFAVLKAHAIAPSNVGKAGEKAS